MLLTLAQTERDLALSEGYWGIALICLIGLAMVLLLLIFILNRRWAARHLRDIEQAKMERRAMRSAGRVDAWRAGADRYVDHDKLPDEAAGDDMAGGRGDDDQGLDDADDGQDPPPGWDEPGPSDDPYGLFDDKPYREADDDEDLDDEEDDEDWQEDDWDDDAGDDDDIDDDEEKGRR